jgi:hypothetical protein
VRNVFDQLAKKIGKGALTPSGLTVVQDEISRDAQHADLRHEPDPARAAERARIGLLGRLASVLCLIEIYGHAPDAAEFRACLGKYIAFWDQHGAAARKKRGRRAGDGAPFLWIIAAGRPTGVLDALKFTRARRWPKGVYLFGEDVLHVGIVVASELPRHRSTLLVRLMAAGPLLQGAIEDLAVLPPDAHERVVVDRNLLGLQHALGKKRHLNPAEKELVVTMQGFFEKAREEGQVLQARAALRRVIELRALAPSAADETKIDRCTNLRTLERWLDQALTAETAAEALRGGTATRRRKTRSS